MSGATQALLAVSRDDVAGTETILLQRLEKANAFNATLVDAISHELERIAARQAATCRQEVVIFRSAHRAFSAGFDLRETAGQTEGDILMRFVRIETLLQRLRRGPLITVAVVDGAAYGAGADLALACTWRIGTPRARFRFPGFGFGVALGTRHLAAVTGPDKARGILLGNRVVEAAEALACGLLTHLVEPDEVEETIATLAAQSARFPAGAVERIIGMTHSDSDDADMADMVRSLSAPGLKDRIAAYLEANAG